MHYSSAHTNLRLQSTVEQASTAKTEFQQESLLAVEAALWYYPRGERGFRLRPDAASSWAAVAAVAKPLLANQRIVGLDLGSRYYYSAGTWESINFYSR